MPEASAVFVDPTGRRRRVIRVAAIVGAALFLGIVALLVAALLGVPAGPLTSLPDTGSGPAPAVEPGGQAPAAGPASANQPGERRVAPAGAWLGFLLLQAIPALVAFRLDGERLGPLLALPL
jgi:hypothetical protein